MTITRPLPDRYITVTRPLHNRYMNATYLQAGDALLLRGPMSGAPSLLPPSVRAIGFVAGGTGVTPMLQVRSTW